jgi:hypothetical protein
VNVISVTLRIPLNLTLKIKSGCLFMSIERLEEIVPSEQHKN